jgi:DnaJ domain
MQLDGTQPAAGQVLGDYSISWQDQNGEQSATGLPGVHFSDREIGISSRQSIPIGRVIHVQAGDGSPNGDYVVRDCRRRGGSYLITAEFLDEANQQAPPANPSFEGPDLYEILQINPKADLETIHRVFRIMAARFHPDNVETGDRERFLELQRAHTVLSDPACRAEYDEFRQGRSDEPIPIFGLKDFVVGIESEKNRRLGVLSLLYNHRRTNPDQPGVSMLDLEQKMDLPREHLAFTMWYLRAKQLVTIADNSDYALTADGAEFVENNAGHSEVFTWLITRGGAKVPAAAEKKRRIESPLLLESSR